MIVVFRSTENAIFVDNLIINRMTPNPLRAITEIDPAFIEKIKKFEEESIYNDGALPKKFKYLMAMAFDATQGAVAGVRFLATRAVEVGATKEEVAEALRLAYHFGGIGSIYIGSQGLDGIFGE
jgi:alkylhydroperoxidase/carboxymuconolactone decarboxylase family protein YurZ